MCGSIGNSSVGISNKRPLNNGVQAQGNKRVCQSHDDDPNQYKITDFFKRLDSIEAVEAPHSAAVHTYMAYSILGNVPVLAEGSKHSDTVPTVIMSTPGKDNTSSTASTVIMSASKAESATVINSPSMYPIPSGPLASTPKQSHRLLFESPDAKAPGTDEIDPSGKKFGSVVYFSRKTYSAEDRYDGGIGSGGDIFQLRDEKGFNTPYLLKVLKPHVRPEDKLKHGRVNAARIAFENTKKEIDALLSMQHSKYSVKLVAYGLDYGVSEEQFGSYPNQDNAVMFIVMEKYVGGDAQALKHVSLEHLTPNSKGKTGFGLYVDSLLTMSKGLRDLHQQDMVHGDIKPDNYFFTIDGDEKLGDFGTVAPYNKNPRDFTFGYLPPESQNWEIADLEPILQVGDVTLPVFEGYSGSDDYRSRDMYALGVTFVSLLLKGKKLHSLVSDSFYDNHSSREVHLEALAGLNRYIDSNYPYLSDVKPILFCLLSPNKYQRPTSEAVVEVLSSLGDSFMEQLTPGSKSTVPQAVRHVKEAAMIAYKREKREIVKCEIWRQQNMYVPPVVWDLENDSPHVQVEPQPSNLDEEALSGSTQPTSSDASSKGGLNSLSYSASSSSFGLQGPNMGEEFSRVSSKGDTWDRYGDEDATHSRADSEEDVSKSFKISEVALPMAPLFADQNGVNESSSKHPSILGGRSLFDIVTGKVPFN